MNHFGDNPDCQAGRKDKETSTSEERLQALRIKLSKERWFQDAEEASGRLANEGCDMPVLMGSVRRIAGYPSGNIGRKAFRIPTGQEVSREIRSIDQQLRNLAKRTAELRKIWGLWARMVEAGAVHVPEELENIAAKLSSVRTQDFWEWFPQREAILELVEQVRTATGRPHYTEVSLLINAELIWVAAKNGRAVPDLKFDSDSLKMIVKRDKQRQALRDRRRSEVKRVPNP